MRKTIALTLRIFMRLPRVFPGFFGREFTGNASAIGMRDKKKSSAHFGGV